MPDNLSKTALVSLVEEKRRECLRLMAQQVNASTVGPRRAAQQALAALDALEKYYKKPSAPPKPVEQPAGSQDENPPGQIDEAAQGGKQPAPPQPQPPEGTAEAPKVSSGGGQRETKEYNPSQLRAPAGSSGGGRWLAGGRSIRTNITADVKGDLEQAIKENGITEDDLKGLRLVSDKPPEGWKLDRDTGMFEAPYSLYGGGGFDGRSLYAGVHEPGVVRIAPGCKDSKNAFLHEMGHHVSNREAVVAARAEKPFKKIEKMDEPELARYGLTWKSTWLKTEFMAETFAVWKRGTPVQKRKLSALYGVRDLKDVFYA
jgi:hypothetical protein